MKLITNCKKCSTLIQTWNLSPDRADFAKTSGEYVNLKCKNCHEIHSYHVDDLEAAPGILIHILGIIILLAGTPLVIYLIWPFLYMKGNPLYKVPLIALTIIPVIVYGILIKNDRNRVRIFNRYKLKREW